MKLINKNKMTAIDMLQERINVGLTYEQEVLFEGLFEQAKEMEKKQIIDAMDICQRTDFYVKYESSEQYYNETYKN
jgi:hypothetical protein